MYSCFEKPGVRPEEGVIPTAVKMIINASNLLRIGVEFMFFWKGRCVETQI
jgi:hypothetical protein